MERDLTKGGIGGIFLDLHFLIFYHIFYRHYTEWLIYLSLDSLILSQAQSLSQSEAR